MKIEHNQLIDAYVGSPTPDAIECRSTVPLWAPIFEAHFPENPILPGALMVEAMAQASGLIELLKSGFTRTARIASVQSAKFKAHAGAGEGLWIRAQATQRGDGFMVCDASVSGDDGRLLADATLTLAFEPFVPSRMRQDVVALLSEGRRGPERPSRPTVSSHQEFMHEP